MESMARVMEAVSGIITNPPNGPLPEKRSTTPWRARKQGIGSLLTPGGGVISTPKSIGGKRGGGNVSMGGGSRYGGTPTTTIGITAKDHAHHLLVKELDRVKKGLTPMKSPGTMNQSNRLSFASNEYLPLHPPSNPPFTHPQPTLEYHLTHTLPTLTIPSTLYIHLLTHQPTYSQR